MQDIITKIRKAKMAHKRWVGHASAMIEGIPVEKDQVPINYTDCVFGHWYYDEGQNLSSLKEFKEIEEPHVELHLIYMEIFQILFKKKKVSFFNKLIGKSSKISDKDKKMARAKFRILDQVSKQIIDKLDALESKLKQLDTKEVAQLY
ncbi:MAG: CZB domain-containing protein [Alcanivoracaceae bacterium]|nr:CZB domain-containing protein [Alcanivoracaceae bacterium]